MHVDWMSTRGCDPLVKWPGGKRSLLKHILPLLPRSYGRYYEPFMGGGALFFRLQPGQSTLSDNNPELINCYVQVRDYPEAVLQFLATYKNTVTDYYSIRESRPIDLSERAARLIFLATLSFNGIYRENLKGQFNVPYGRKSHLLPCDATRILAVSAALSESQLLCDDFEFATEGAQAGDLIYFDPPYTVAHGTNGFVKYNARIFKWEDQQRLAEIARSLNSKGCAVIVSNADHPSVRALYTEFKVEVVSRFSRIAAAGNHRRQVTECIFHNGW